MSCDVDPNDKISAVQPNNDEGVEQVEANGRDDEQIHRGDMRGMIGQKGARPWLGGRRRLAMYLATLDRETSNPSLSNSPWMRGAPHSGFSTLTCRMSARSSV